ncbi:MAG TPA: helix-turn-helix domain-containing protein [Vicinamibacterales bacterium]|jgi:excisionase family DNA binding protein|nr:helix-turn-helix domain-containing protein [Vicinamibacterales bacterium]
MTEDVLLTFADTASALNVDVVTVRRLVDAGRLRTVQIGRSVRIPKASLAELAGAPSHADQLADLAARVAALEVATS